MNAITELADKIDARLNLNAVSGTEIRFTMTASAAAEYAKQLRLTAKMVDEIERLRAALAVQQDGARKLPHKETIAREIRRAMLDNPTDSGFNARAEKREQIADATADVILELFSRPEQ